MVISAWPLLFPTKPALQVQAFGPPEATTEQISDFSASAAGGSPPYSYKWYFEDGQVGEGQNVTHKFVRPQTYTTSLIVTDHDGNSATTAIPTVVKSLSPGLTILEFTPSQGVNPFGVPRFFNDHHPPCGGPTLPSCDYGEISGSVKNTGPGQASSCQLQVHETVHIDNSVLLLNNVPRDQSSDLSTGTIPSGESKDFRISLNLQYPGDYTFNGQIVCANGLSDKVEKPLHVR